MIRRTNVRLGAVVVALGGAAVGLLFAGPLDPPPGPVTSTYKTLSEVEPRVAVNAANTPGDADALFKITQPGSYYLTGNISGVANKHGVEIAASGVTLDLSGFTLRGVPGSRDGVSVVVTNLAGVAVRGGSVSDWGGDGIDLAATTNSAVSGIRALDNSGDGILAGRGCMLTASTASSNARGISTGDACVILACTAVSNGISGIVAGESCTITSCSADGNGEASTGLSEGIFADNGSTILACTSRNNTSALVGGVGDRGMGFRTGDRCTIKDCVASSNRGHGFRILGSSRISGCSSSQNGAGSTASAAIHVVGSDNQIDTNQVNSSDFGVQVLAPGNFIIRNTASGNGISYSLAANNIYGPIVDRRIPGGVPSTPAVSGFEAPGTLGSADANANFSY